MKPKGIFQTHQRPQKLPVAPAFPARRLLVLQTSRQTPLGRLRLGVASGPQGQNAAELRLDSFLPVMSAQRPS